MKLQCWVSQEALRLGLVGLVVWCTVCGIRLLHYTISIKLWLLPLLSKLIEIFR